MSALRIRDRLRVVYPVEKLLNAQPFFRSRCEAYLTTLRAESMHEMPALRGPGAAASCRLEIVDAPLRMYLGIGALLSWFDGETNWGRESAQIRARTLHLVQSGSHERQRSLAAAAYLPATAVIAVDLCACQAGTLVAPPVSRRSCITETADARRKSARFAH